MDRTEWCVGCGTRLGDDWDASLPSEQDRERCIACVEREQRRAALAENVRRLKAWAVREKTRRKIAEALANECAKYDPDSEAHYVWAFVWEVSGDTRELRKLVEQLGNRIVVNDPMGNRPPTRAASG